MTRTDIRVAVSFVQVVILIGLSSRVERDRAIGSHGRLRIAADRVER
jgi:hypothetical protein